MIQNSIKLTLMKYKISKFKFIFPILLLTSQIQTVKGNEYLMGAIYADVFSAGTSEPIDESIAVAAPHLPVIQKFEGSGNSFKYKKIRYQYDEKTLKTWIQTYPEEFTNYCIAMKALLNETKESSLSPVMKAIYTDLRAQYLMIKKTTNI
jgi:hypothetical protein